MRRESEALGEVAIDRMTEADVKAVHAIERQVFPTPWSVMGFVGGIARPEANIMLVAKMSGHVVGYTCLFYTLDGGHITNIAVDPTFQRRGIGSRLLLALIEEAVRRGIRSVFLEVRESNMIGQRLYRKFGFEYQGVRPGYYADTGEDALVYWVDDIGRLGYRRLLKSLAEEARRGAGAG